MLQYTHVFFYCTTYGLVSRVRTGGSSVFTCSHKGCDHVATLKEWYALNGLNEETSDIWSSVGSRGQKLHSYAIPDDPICHICNTLQKC